MRNTVLKKRGIIVGILVILVVVGFYTSAATLDRKADEDAQQTETKEPAQQPTLIPEEKPLSTEEPTSSEEPSGQSLPEQAEKPGNKPSEKTDEDLPPLEEIAPNLPDDPAPPIQIDPTPETDTSTDFEKYNSMSESEQKKFYESFDTPEDFFEWYNAAKDEYEKENGDILIDDNTNIDLGG